MIRRGSGRAAVVLGAGTTIAGGLPVFLIGALFAQLQADVHAPAWVLGVAVAAFWAAAAAVSLLSGRIISAIGTRSATLVTLAGAALSLVGSALLVPDWHWLVAWAAVGGAANGLGHPASNALIGAQVSPRRMATALGIKQAAVPFAAFLAGLAVPLIAIAAGWSWAYVAASALVGLLVIAFLVWSPSRITPALRRRIHEPLPAPLLRTLLFLASATTLGAAAAGAVSAYSVTAAIDRGISDGAAGVLLSVGSLLGAGCRVAVGVVADRFGGRVALPLTASLLGAGAVGALLLVIPSPVVFAVGVVLALGPGWGWTGLTHFVVARIAGPATPSATGVVQTGSYLGSGAGPLVFGLFYAGAGGASWTWIAVALIAVVAASLAWVLSRRMAVAGVQV